MIIIDELHEVKKPFQDSYDYLKDRYNIKHSYSTFEKNNRKKGFYHDADDFDLIVMATLVSMGLITEAYREANEQSSNYIADLEQELERAHDELAEELTKDKGLRFIKFDDIDYKNLDLRKLYNNQLTKPTLKENISFIKQAFKEAWFKTFKKNL